MFTYLNFPNKHRIILLHTARFWLGHTVVILEGVGQQLDFSIKTMEALRNVSTERQQERE